MAASALDLCPWARNASACDRPSCRAQRGPTGQGQATAEAVQRATRDRPPNTGPAAPAHERAGQAGNPASRGPWIPTRLEPAKIHHG